MARSVSSLLNTYLFRQSHPMPILGIRNLNTDCNISFAIPANPYKMFIPLAVPDTSLNALMVSLRSRTITEKDTITINIPVASRTECCDTLSRAFLNYFRGASLYRCIIKDTLVVYIGNGMITNDVFRPLFVLGDEFGLTWKARKALFDTSVLINSNEENKELVTFIKNTVFKPVSKTMLTEVCDLGYYMSEFHTTNTGLNARLVDSIKSELRTNVNNIFY